MSVQRPIRVMRIIARLNVGGPALHVTLLTERLRPPEFESTLVCGRIGPGEGDMAYLAEERGITPVYVPELGRELHPLRDLVTLIKLWRLMRRLKRSLSRPAHRSSRPHAHRKGRFCRAVGGVAGARAGARPHLSRARVSRLFWRPEDALFPDA